MTEYLGDFYYQQTIYLMVNTHKADGTPVDAAGSPAVSVYKDDVTTESTAGITLVAPFDSRTGLMSIKIVTTDAFYAVGHDYNVVVTTGTVDSVSVVSYVLAHFSIENRSPLDQAASNHAIAGSFGKYLGGAPAGATDMADIAAIKAKTDTLPAVWCGT